MLAPPRAIASSRNALSSPVASVAVVVVRPRSAEHPVVQALAADPEAGLRAVVRSRDEAVDGLADGRDHSHLGVLSLVRSDRLVPRKSSVRLGSVRAPRCRGPARAALGRCPAAVAAAGRLGLPLGVDLRPPRLAQPRGRPVVRDGPDAGRRRARHHAIRLGTFVASPNFRHPVPFAKELMTLDDLSGGRFQLGVGAGGPGFDATVLGVDELTPRPAGGPSRRVRRAARPAADVAVHDVRRRRGSPPRGPDASPAACSSPGCRSWWPPTARARCGWWPGTARPG